MTNQNADVDYAALSEVDVQEVPKGSAGKPWLVVHANGEVEEYDTENEACTRQRYLALVKVLSNMVECFDVSDSPDHNDYQVWLEAKSLVRSARGQA